jgi:hypothetical protein
MKSELPERIKGISDILKKTSGYDENFKLLMDYSANHLLALKQYPRFYKIKRWCFTLQNSEFNLTNRYIQYSNETKESLLKRTRLYIRYF